MNFTVGGLLAALLIMLCALWRRDSFTAKDFCVAIGLFWALVALAESNSALSAGSQGTFDRTLYRIDLWMGLDPWILIRWLASMPIACRFLALIYFSLPIAFALLWICEHPANLLPAVLIGPALAFACYHLVPAVGPIHLGDARAPINCFPSMHVTWVLLFARSARGTLLRFALWTFAALTMLATVGLGEHYFVDLIAAVPFCYAVEALANMSFAFRRHAEVIP